VTLTARLSALASAASLATLLLFAAPEARAQSAEPLEEREVPTLSLPEEAAGPEQTLERLEEHLNAIRSLQGRFVQTTSRGGRAEGEVALLRPGRVRFDYDSPNPTLLVADGLNFVVYDRELEQATMIPLRRTPLWLLLREEVRLDDGLDILEVERGDGYVAVLLRQADAPEEGTIELVFETEPLALRLWEVVDSQGVRTQVELFDLDYETRPSPVLFNVQDLPGIRPPGFDRTN